MLSIWEKNHWTYYDLLVIGSGIAGLSTALSWREKNPHDDILVLERSTIPAGASLRNAGFACFGSLTELLADIDQTGEEECILLVEKRWKGLQKLRKRLGDKNMDFRLKGGYELLRENETEMTNQVDYVNSLLQPLFGKPVFSNVTEKIAAFGFNKNVIKGLLFNPLEGQINSGLMMKNLARMARQKNIEIRTGCNVKQIDTGEIKVVIEDNIRDDYFIEGKKLALCNNALAASLLPALPISPGRGIVVVTEKMDKLPFEGTFHYDRGFYYFRDFGQQVIFGGGRNLYPEEEKTTSFEVNKKIRDHLIRELNHTLMPGHNPKITTSWAGIMAFGPDKKPVIQLVNNNIGVAAGFSGMGVAICTTAGEELSDLLNEQ